MRFCLRYPNLLLSTLGVILIAACGARLAPPADGPGAASATASVERFLQLAADQDYRGMGWTFGTSGGPIIQRDPVGQVEQRMHALANMLRYDGFAIGSGAPVPGRTQEAIRFAVVLQRGPQNVQVPFTTVRGPGGRWFVEQVAVEAITDLP
jgi:hypothetical protein